MYTIESYRAAVRRQVSKDVAARISGARGSGTLSHVDDDERELLESELCEMGDDLFESIFDSFAWRTVDAPYGGAAPKGWSRQPLLKGSEGETFTALFPEGLGAVLTAYRTDAPDFLRSAVLERVVVDMLVFTEFRATSLQLAGRLEMKGRKRMAVLGPFWKELREALPRAETASKMTYVALGQASIDWLTIKRLVDAAREEGVGWYDVLTEFVDWLASEEARESDAP